MASKPQRASELAIITSLILSGFLLRVTALDQQPLSGDEAFSIMNWTRVSLEHLLNNIALIDPQPPAALLSLYAWVRIAGDSIFAARMLSCLAGTITIATSYRIARSLTSPTAARLTTLFLAFNPYQIWHAQDIRSYALWTAISTTSLLLLIKALRRPTNWRHWAGYALTEALSVYTFYLELFLLAAHNTYVITGSHKYRKLLRRWIASQASIALLLAPWLLRPALRHSGYTPTGGLPNIPQALSTFLFGSTLPATFTQPLATLAAQTLSIASVLALILIIGSLLLLHQTARSDARKLLTLVIAMPPLLLATLTLTTGQGYFHPRYISATAPLLVITLAAGITARSIRTYPRPHTSIASSIAAFVMLLSILSLVHYRFDAAFRKAPPWPQIVSLLEEQAGANDLILRNFPDPAFDYYYGGATANTTLPTAENPPPWQTRNELRQLVACYDYIWFLPTESSAFDSERVVASWLADNTQLISDQWIASTRLLQYAPWDSIPSSYEPLTSTSFPPYVSLFGYRVTPSPKHWLPGSTIFVELFWEPLSPTPRSLTIFLHLIGPVHTDSLRLWSQDDHPPQHGRLATNTWTPGKPFRDVYILTIPSSIPPATYAITTGFYDPETGVRLPLAHTSPAGEPDGSLVLEVSIPPANE